MSIQNSIDPYPPTPLFDSFPWKSIISALRSSKKRYNDRVGEKKGDF